MSAEHVRRRLVLKLGGKPDAIYIDKIGKAMLDFEQSKNSQIDIITRSKRKADVMEFTLANGDAYELINYADPSEDERKTPGYKPPEIKINKIEEQVIDDSDDGPFTIVHFVLCTILAGLVALSAVIVWFTLKLF